MARSIDRIVIAHIDWDDLVVLDQQFKGNPIGQVDRYGMQAGEPAVQGMPPQRWVTLENARRSGCTGR
jgi:hypothetical protein